MCCRHCEEPVGQMVIDTTMIPPPLSAPPPPPLAPEEPWNKRFRGVMQDPDPVATQPIPPTPKAGDRVEDGGVMGTLIRCEKCSGDGLLHQPDPEFFERPTPEPLDPDPVATQPMPPFEVDEADWNKVNKPPKVLPRSYLMWLAVDLDSTLAQGVWTPEEPTSEIGDPIWENVAKVRELAAKGWKIVIHTARPWHDYEAIEVWANHYKVPVSRIVCGKLLAAAYIDDRAIDAADPDWTPRSHDARTA